MNAALRSVVRTALHHGLEVYAVAEGYRGLVEGDGAIRRLESADVGGILQRGGTVIGTARSADFRTREGRRKAAANLIHRGIDALVVIGGDGSLTGANLFREEWPELLAELVAEGAIPSDAALAHPVLRLAGLVGSIDNDMIGTDMTIGADTALHRIVEASMRSTAPQAATSAPSSSRSWDATAATSPSWQRWHPERTGRSSRRDRRRRTSGARRCVRPCRPGGPAGGDATWCLAVRSDRGHPTYRTMHRVPVRATGVRHAGPVQ